MRALKQYGERRTGTNYLRALLRANHPDLPIFMHVLGDKHSPPVDLPACWAQARACRDPLFAFVTSATLAAPAETTHEQDPGQRRYLRQVADQLDESFDPGQLGFLISVKHPCAWVVSLARYCRWLDSPTETGGMTMGLAHRNSLEIACRHYNRRHRSWLRLVEQAGERTLVVRYERLLENPHATLARIRRKFKLPSCGSTPVRIAHRVAPTHWDDHPITLEPDRFDPQPYLDRGYQDLLSEEMWTVVRDTIDWDLAAKFGYGGNHFRTRKLPLPWLAPHP